MTKEISTEKSRIHATVRSIIYLTATLLFGVCLSGEAAEYVKEGMELAVTCVLPASFPFMIISDAYVHYGHPENIRALGTFVRIAFGLPVCALGALICGNVGGFPIGAKITSELYTSGAIDKRSAERLLALSSNPSCAFVIGGVGLGMYGDTRLGFILLASVYLSTVLCGFITKQNQDESMFSNEISRQKYDFVSSVKASGISLLGVISFVSFFSVVIGIVNTHIKIPLLLYPLTAVSEVTNAVKTFSNTELFPLPIGLFLTGFSLGFGGVSVMMQSAAFTEGSGLEMKKYAWLKLLQGVICGALASLASLLIRA